MVHGEMHSLNLVAMKEEPVGCRLGAIIKGVARSVLQTMSALASILSSPSSKSLKSSSKAIGFTEVYKVNLRLSFWGELMQKSYSHQYFIGLALI